ncbi:MAG: hypothetical protein ABS52_10775 [Gemmatimonadetes bacterium SCN 70-22]|nr:MAG: hypothetical protein ABS52_10775 [Gemmatimonadetes bacterium SCN 70-22]
MPDPFPFPWRALPRAAMLVALLMVAPSGARAQAPAAGRLSLGEVVQMAASRNAAVDAARARTAQAQARVRQRRADLFPSLSAAAVQAGRTFNTATLGFAFRGSDGVPLFNPDGQVEGPVLTTDLRAHASQALFDAGAMARVSAARAAASATETEAAAAAEQAAGAAAIAYVRLLRADAQVAARQADSALAGELLVIAQEQLRAGVGVALDVTRARAQAAQVRAQLIAARADRAHAALELARLLALPADAPVAAADSLGALAIAADDSAGNLQQALARRPELRSLDAQLHSVQQQERAVRRERLPTLSAFGDNGPIAGEGGSYLRTYNWGVQLSLPLFDGFRREGRLEEQAAVHRELEVRRHDLAQQVALEVRGANEDLAFAREQLDAARERVALAEQELAQARDRFRAGVAGNADAVTASLALNAARTLLIDATAAWHGARIALARALGEARTLH